MYDSFMSLGSENSMYSLVRNILFLDFFIDLLLGCLTILCYVRVKNLL